MAASIPEIRYKGLLGIKKFCCWVGLLLQGHITHQPFVT